jgi:mRNA interferase RelE/StbE
LACNIQFDKKALKELKGIATTDAKRILLKIESELANKPGADKRLKGNKATFYSYRVGTYRIIYELSDNLIIIAKISHRKNAYE